MKLKITIWGMTTFQEKKTNLELWIHLGWMKDFLNFLIIKTLNLGIRVISRGNRRKRSNLLVKLPNLRNM